MYIEKSECPFFAKGIQLILYVKVIYANNNVLACVVHSYTIYVEIDYKRYSIAPIDRTN